LNLEWRRRRRRYLSAGGIEEGLLSSFEVRQLSIRLKRIQYLCRKETQTTTIRARKKTRGKGKWRGGKRKEVEKMEMEEQEEG